MNGKHMPLGLLESKKLGNAFEIPPPIHPCIHPSIDARSGSSVGPDAGTTWPRPQDFGQWRESELEELATMREMDDLREQVLRLQDACGGIGATPCDEMGPV